MAFKDYPNFGCSVCQPEITFFGDVESSKTTVIKSNNDVEWHKGFASAAKKTPSDAINNLDDWKGTSYSLR